jgi:hypothetical protein
VLGLAVLAGAAVTGYAKWARPWHLRWGATDDELTMHLPGDEFVAHRDTFATRAITVDAPAEDIWPWIAQIGQNKAGSYSYAWLENLVGCQMPDVREIVPEWQEIHAGDEVWLHPKAAPLVVQFVNPRRDLVLDRAWSFHLRPLDETHTRLIVRSQGEFARPDLGPIGNFIYWRGIFEPAHFIMERKMLVRMKELAERHAIEREAATLIGVP